METFCKPESKGVVIKEILRAMERAMETVMKDLKLRVARVPLIVQ
jgi:hypothetical protein